MTKKQNEISKANNLRLATYRLLESETSSSVTAKIITWLLILLIVSNVAAAIIASEQEYYLSYKNTFIIFELISLSIFCFEYNKVAD